VSETNETSLANDAAARTATGEIKDQATKPDQTSDQKIQTTQDTGVKDKQATELADKAKSLLNQAKPEAKAPAGAPEAYTEFKVPEGFALDETVSKEASALFKSSGLNQEQAQAFVDFYTAKTKEAFDAPYNAWRDTQEKWVNEIKADSEIGGKLDSVKATISKAIDGLGDTKLANDFREAMDFTGAGNNPAFIRAFYRLAQKVTEGGAVTGRGPSPLGQKEPGAGPPSVAAALFPNLPSARGT
jgi:hypothetical protein